MSFEVQLEVRQCLKCGRKFKVMLTSKELFCNLLCRASGTAAPGEVQRPSNEGKNNFESIVVGNTIRQLQSGPGSRPVKLEEKNSIQKNLRPSLISITEKIKENSMLNEQSAEKEMLPVTMNTKNSITITQEELKKYSNTGIEKTQPESLDAPLKTIEMESLTILDLSKRSAGRLLSLMELSVSDEMIQKQKDEILSVELDRIKTAIDCANAISNTVQTNINLLKAIKK